MFAAQIAFSDPHRLVRAHSSWLVDSGPLDSFLDDLVPVSLFLSGVLRHEPIVLCVRKQGEGLCAFFTLDSSCSWSFDGLDSLSSWS